MCRGNGHLWKKLADRQWKLCPILMRDPTDDDDAAVIESRYRLEFKRRFELDVAIARIIQNMSSMLDLTDLGPELRRNSYYPNVNQNDWITLNKTLIDSIMANSTQALDGLQRMAVSAESTRTKDEWIVRWPTPLEACLACQVMDNLFFSHVRFQWNRLLEDPHKPPDKLLREGAVLLAKLCIGYDALTHLDELDLFDDAVEIAVTMYAEALSMRLESEYGAAAAVAAAGASDPEQHRCCTAVQAVQCLLRLLQQAGWLFDSTHNKRYDKADSSVNEVISKRFGGPLAQNLILQWILQKVNVESSLIDLREHKRGHVLLGVTEQTGRVRYFDVFLPTDEPLTELDHRSLVVGLVWPMTPIETLTRMLRNIQCSSLARKSTVRMNIIHAVSAVAGCHDSWTDR
jgi:hypothetical protein